MKNERNNSTSPGHCANILLCVVAAWHKLRARMALLWSGVGSRGSGIGATSETQSTKPEKEKYVIYFRTIGGQQISHLLEKDKRVLIYPHVNSLEVKELSHSEFLEKLYPSKRK
jgi:hypothetical protein